MNMIRPIYHGYVKGQIIEDATDFLLDKVYKTSDSSSDMNRTMTKIAIYWLHISLLIIVTVNSMGLFPGSAVLGIFGLIPFAVPFYSNAKTLIQAKNGLSFYQRVPINASCFALACAEAGAVLGLSRKLSISSCTSASLALSNAIIGCGLWITSALFRRKSEADLVIEECRVNCGRLKIKIEDLKLKIKIIDDFVSARSELKKVVEEHIEKFGQYIADTKEVHVDIKGPDDWIGQEGALSIERIDLEHWLNERKRFIRMHSRVKECFEKHILAMQNGQDRIETSANSAGSVQIEEINDESTRLIP